MTTKRVCLWSSPRNLSTALMYSFAQRPDTKVVDEPLYAHYLLVTKADHPGEEEIIASQETDSNMLIDYLLNHDFEKPIVFFKQMTHHLVDMSLDFLSKTDNIIYIRNPKQIISSYAAVRPHVSMEDIGIKMQWELYSHLHNNHQNCVVFDSALLLDKPEKALQSLCSALPIPFYNEMLSWPAGPKKEDGIWAKYWYKNVHQSTGFEPQETSNRQLPKHLEPLYEECRYYYNLLSQHAITI